MITGGIGGANTQTGLNFERAVDFHELLATQTSYAVKASHGEAGRSVWFNGQLVARCLRKHEFYGFLEENRVNWKTIVSKKLLPDDALIVFGQKTLFIIEVKYQQVAGSVDEKLQTCDFKRRQYDKLVSGLGLKVEYIYVLNDWFKDPAYRDVLNYIHNVNCSYVFNSLPLSLLGLPAPH